MSWTAVVPMKQGPERKSRLASRLSDQVRATLSDHMAAHVLECLHESPSIGRIVILSPTPVAEDRKSVVEGKSVSVRVDLGGRRIIKKKKNNIKQRTHTIKQKQ